MVLFGETGIYNDAEFIGHVLDEIKNVIHIKRQHAFRHLICSLLLRDFKDCIITATIASTDPRLHGWDQWRPAATHKQLAIN